MTVKSITLSGFRNYSSATVAFSDGANIITGANAQGKTNLLEAIYLLTSGRSFRTRTDREMIGDSVSEAEVCGEAEAAGRQHNVSIRLAEGKRKQIRQNGVNKTASELSGELRAVLFLPDDLNIISDGARAGRKFMDTAISRLKPAYAELIAEYARALEQKMRILRDRREKPALLALLDDFSDVMCKYSSRIIRYRAAYVCRLNQKAAILQNEMSGDADRLEIRYRADGAPEDPTAPADELYERLRAHMVSRREAELRSGLCLAGVHRDGLDIAVNGKEARVYASRGQMRTAAVAIKMAEREICSGETGERPLLLLDDVLSELDSRRREYVLGKTGEGQTFITGCDNDTPAPEGGGKLIRVTNGCISEP